jgi:hypothetical protein
MKCVYCKADEDISLKELVEYYDGITSDDIKKYACFEHKLEIYRQDKIMNKIIEEL